MNETFGVKNKVLRLDISMDDLLTMHKLEANKNAGGKVSGLLLTKMMFSAYVVSQVTSRHQIHHQIEGISVLESLAHIDDKFMLQLFEQLSFVTYGLIAFLG